MIPQWRIERAIIPLTVQIAGAYVANDSVGGVITIPLSGVTGGGFINRIQLIDKDNEKAVFTLRLYDNAPTAVADADAFVRDEDEAIYEIGSIAIPAANYTSDSATAFAIARCSGKDEVDGEFISWEYAPTGAIYGYLICTATPTYTAATDLTLIVEMYLS